MSSVVIPKDFKATNVTITPVKVMDSGAKQAYVNYEGRHQLLVQVTGLNIPYGMSMFDKAGPIKYSVDLSLKGYDVEGSKVKQIYDAFNNLDEYMIEMGVKNSKSWFKKELSSDIIREFYTPCVRFSKDAEGNLKPYPPTLKIQLKQRDGKFETAVYDDKRQPLTDVPLEDILVKGATISSLIQCTGVWFAGSKFGLSWKAIQIKADHLPESIRGFAFRDEEDVQPTTTSRSATAAAPATAPPTAPAVPQHISTNNFAALAEDDEVDDDAILNATQTQGEAQAKTLAAPPTMDDDADIVEPVVVPKKPAVTSVKKVVSKVLAKK
jgi:hypothetical protein